jgi:hypothetical protein
MMIILTEQDLAKMPAMLRRELQQFLLTRLDGEEHDVFVDEYDVDELPNYLDTPSFTEAENSQAKQVIDINDVQAQALIGNLSEKSISTLRRFAGQEAVPLDDLLGEGKPYTNFTDLKRSFVGAVNRRLRTVTRNRSAVLFRKTAPDDLDGRDGIAVRPKTAMALATLFLRSPNEPDANDAADHD